MAEEETEVRQIPYRRLFAWLELFRAFRIARDPKKLVLGALGVVLMYAGSIVIGSIWDAIGDGDPRPVGALQALSVDMEETAVDVQSDLRPLVGLLGISGGPAREGAGVGALLEVPLRPARIFVAPFASLFSVQPSQSWTLWSRWFVTLLSAAWMVLVWAFCGGAICRLAAVQVARDENIGFGQALRFTWQKYVSYVAAPLIPLGFIAAILAACFLGGGIAWLTSLVNAGVVGAVIDGVLLFLLLAAGFLLAIILVGLAVGWPLMLPTIGAEGSDSFDALSRSYSYVFQRPWHYLFYTVVATVYGAAVIAFVFGFAYLLVHLSAWAASTGAGRGMTAVFFERAPLASGWGAIADSLKVSPSGAATEAPGRTTQLIANVLGAVWLYPLFLLVVGFLHSYFWSAATTVYFLLRRDVDATDLDEVYLEEEEEEEFGAPLPPPDETEPDVVAAPPAPEEVGSGAGSNAPADESAEADPPEDKPEGEE